MDCSHKGELEKKRDHTRAKEIIDAERDRGKKK